MRKLYVVLLVVLVSTLAGALALADVPKGPLYLMSITINARTGAELGRKIDSGPYDTVQACADVQRQTGMQQVVVTTDPPQITVIECAVSHVDTST